MGESETTVGRVAKIDVIPDARTSLLVVGSEETERRKTYFLLPFI